MTVTWVPVAKRYEYRMIWTTDPIDKVEAMLNTLGQEGWRLTLIAGARLILERELGQAL